jgi:AcrR family transcriptional regulator
MTNEATSTPRPLGRPRDERADRAILAAALELMAEHGVRDLRMDDVAERAGVGKATIYRRYRSKDELITDAVAALVSEITVPDTGSTRADLLALMRRAVKMYRGSVEAGVMPGLVDATWSWRARCARDSSPGVAPHCGLCWSAVSSAATCVPTSTSSSPWTCSAGRSSTGSWSRAVPSTDNSPTASSS